MNCRSLAFARDDRRRGFTLVEVVVVLLILGAVTAVTVPAFRDAPTTAGVQRGAEEVRRLLDRARATARANGHAVTVTIDPRSARWWLDRPALTGRIELQRDVSLWSDAPRATVVFAAAGAANAARIAVQGGGRTIPIVIDPFTGQVDAR